MGAPQRGQGRLTGGRKPGRFSARRKTEAILRLLRGEWLDRPGRYEDSGRGEEHTMAVLDGLETQADR